MKIWILIITSLSYGHIPLGSLGGFLSISEVYDRLRNLTETYPNLLTLDSSSGFDTLIMKNSTIHTDYYKPIILVTGGLYAGYPMGTFHVLQLADSLSDQYSSGNTILNLLIETNEIHFIPILNYAGYNYMQKNYKNSTFQVVKTGLEGNSLNCSEYDVGINPNHNFPYKFGNDTNQCSNDYQGTKSSSSNITIAIIKKYFSTTKVPVLLFNYQGLGNAYYTPYAYANLTLDAKVQEYYNYLYGHIPSGYSYQSFASMNEAGSFGTFLDYAFSSSTYVLEIGLGNVSNIPSSLIYNVCDENYDFFVKASYHFCPGLMLEIQQPIEIICESDCSYYSILSFVIRGGNINAFDYYFTLTFDPGFGSLSNYNLVSIESVSKFKWSGATVSIFPSSSASSVPYTISGSIPGYADYTLYFNYSRSFESNSNSYSANANFVSDTKGYYVDPIILSVFGNLNDIQTSDDSEKTGIVVGLVLLLVLLILVIIAGIVLYCTRRHENFDQKLANDPRAFGPDARV